MRLVAVHRREQHDPALAGLAEAPGVQGPALHRAADDPVLDHGRAAGPAAGAVGDAAGARARRAPEASAGQQSADERRRADERDEALHTAEVR